MCRLFDRLWYVVLRLSAGTQELTSGIQESTTAAALADSLTHFNEAPLADTDLQSQSKDTPTDMYVLSPNPAKDRVDIDLSSSQGKPVELTLTTFFGKVMHHEKIGSVGTARHTLYLNDIGKGQYFLRIQTPGQKPVMKKLIVIQ